MKYHLTITDDEGEIVKNNTYDSPAEIRKAVGLEDTVEILDLNAWGDASHSLALEKGFTSTDPLEKIALMHAELSEIVEALREDQKPSTKCPMITCEAEEVADTFIRLAQYARMRGIDFDFAVRVKHDYNTRRPHKHGKKF